jgi:hypothetical protein
VPRCIPSIGGRTSTPSKRSIAPKPAACSARRSSAVVQATCQILSRSLRGPLPLEVEPREPAVARRPAAHHELEAAPLHRPLGRHLRLEALRGVEIEVEEPSRPQRARGAAQDRGELAAIGEVVERRELADDEVEPAAPTAKSRMSPRRTRSFTPAFRARRCAARTKVGERSIASTASPFPARSTAVAPFPQASSTTLPISGHAFARIVSRACRFMAGMPGTTSS